LAEQASVSIHKIIQVANKSQWQEQGGSDHEDSTTGLPVAKRFCSWV